MNIKEIFDEIANEPGTNAKMDILRKYRDNELLKKVLYQANSKRIKFYIKQIPEFLSQKEATLSLNYAVDMLAELSNRNKTGHDASNYLRQILAALTLDDAKIIIRIIEKDCKIGMGTTNMNKIFKGLIEETPYMGAKSYDIDLAKKIFDKKGFGYSQTKMDGRYANIIIRNSEVEAESRGGEPSILPGAKFLEELTHFDDCVLNGELTMTDIEKTLNFNSNEVIVIDNVEYTKDEIINKFKHLLVE